MVDAGLNARLRLERCFEHGDSILIGHPFVADAFPVVMTALDSIMHLDTQERDDIRITFKTADQSHNPVALVRHLVRILEHDECVLLDLGNPPGILAKINRVNVSDGGGEPITIHIHPVEWDAYEEIYPSTHLSQERKQSIDQTALQAASINLRYLRVNIEDSVRSFERQHELEVSEIEVRRTNVAPHGMERQHGLRSLPEIAVHVRLVESREAQNG